MGLRNVHECHQALEGRREISEYKESVGKRASRIISGNGRRGKIE